MVEAGREAKRHVLAGLLPASRRRALGIAVLAAAGGLLYQRHAAAKAAQQRRQVWCCTRERGAPAPRGPVSGFQPRLCSWSGGRPGLLRAVPPFGYCILCTGRGRWQDGSPCFRLDLQGSAAAVQRQRRVARLAPSSAPLHLHWPLLCLAPHGAPTAPTCSYIPHGILSPIFCLPLYCRRAAAAAAAGGAGGDGAQRPRGGAGRRAPSGAALKQLLPLLLRVAGRKVLAIALLALARTALSNRLARLQVGPGDDPSLWG